MRVVRLHRVVGEEVLRERRVVWRMWLLADDEDAAVRIDLPDPLRSLSRRHPPPTIKYSVSFSDMS